MELSGSRRCVVDGRRHDPWLAQTVWAARDRGADQLRHGRQRRFFEYRARRRFESLRRRDAAALDAPGRCLDRTGIWPRLRKPFGTDRVVASPGARISQAECHPDQDKQKSFIENYEKLLNSLGDDEAV